MEKDDKVKIRNKICAEKVFTARAEMEFMTDSEESGLEYESATDHEHDDDTLVHGDDSKYTLFKEPRLRVNFIDALFAPQAVSNRKVRR